MREVITIQIPRPKFDELDAKHRKELIEIISKNVAEQIVFQEEMRKKSEEIKYWQSKFIEWQIDDALNEIKYGNKDTKRIE